MSSRAAALINHQKATRNNWKKTKKILGLENFHISEINTASTTTTIYYTAVVVVHVASSENHGEVEP